MRTKFVTGRHEDVHRTLQTSQRSYAEGQPLITSFARDTQGASQIGLGLCKILSPPRITHNYIDNQSVIMLPMDAGFKGLTARFRAIITGHLKLICEQNQWAISTGCPATKSDSMSQRTAPFHLCPVTSTTFHQITTTTRKTERSGHCHM